MKKNCKRNKSNYNIYILISILIIIISFLIYKPLVLRPILIIIAILIFSYVVRKKYKLKNSSTIITILILVFISIILDTIAVVTLNRIPIFAYNIITNKNVRVYNSIGIRVWQCDKDDYNNLIVDPFYKKGYMCDAENMEALEVNSFLNSVVENYKDYKNMYLKINGKISKKNGQNYIEMKPYESTDITVNGYVNFADNITLRIIFQENASELDDYDIYDEITIVGIIKNLEQENDKYIVYMYDSKVVSKIDLKEYTITATAEKKCSQEKTLIYSNETNDVYLYCLEDVIVSYKDNKYEIATALSANKLNIDNLKDDPEDIEINEENQDTIYRFENYSVLFCNSETSKDIIIGNKNMKFSSVTCNIKDNQE